MRILFIHSIGKYKYGGGERWVVKAAAGLQKAGHEVYLGGRSDSILLKEAAQAGIETEGFNIYSDLSLYQSYRIARFIRKNNIEVLISKRRDLGVAGIAAKMAGNPLVLTRSGSPPQRSIKKHIYLMRNLADGIITNTETIKKTYQDNGITEEDFIRVIYNGLTLNDNTKPFNFQEVFPGKKVILCLGRAVADKGYYYIIDALELLKDKLKDIIVYVIGDGKEREELVRYAESRGVGDLIFFAGYISQPDGYLKGCDLFVHASLYEGMPNAPMEAMAYGKPTIMTRVNGADELSDGGKFARLIPPADSKAIAQAIEEYFSNTDAFHRTAAEARDYVRKKFTVGVMIEQIEQFIGERSNKKV